MDWPKKSVQWVENKTLYVSIPFTWELPLLAKQFYQRSFLWEKVVVGGPGIYLMPDFFKELKFVKIGENYPGILQKINPLATRTSIGCVRKCEFCAIGTNKIESGGLQCLEDWPDLPIVCDNNLLATPRKHFDKVIDRLKKHTNVDFNQGIDSRLLTDYHAKRISEIKRIKPMGIRLALDSLEYRESWEKAFDRLRNSGIAKRKISSYALVGFNTSPKEAWERCKWIETHGIKVLPMWFHGLNQLKKNVVGQQQADIGWNDFERRKIMQWYYQHKMAKQYDGL